VVLCVSSQGTGDVGSWLGLDGETHTTAGIGEQISGLTTPQTRNLRWKLSGSRVERHPAGVANPLPVFVTGPADSSSNPSRRSPEMRALGPVPSRTLGDLQTVVITI
jgi:hypothetical protein